MRVITARTVYAGVTHEIPRGTRYALWPEIDRETQLHGSLSLTTMKRPFPLLAKGRFIFFFHKVSNRASKLTVPLQESA